MYICSLIAKLMATTTDTFTQFCTYVDEIIFSEENKGEVVAFIVDQTFINDFCKEYHTKEGDLLISAMRKRYLVARDPLLAKGMIALQVFAATKRANSDGFTENNYNDRLVDLLFVDYADLENWYKDYQDRMWRTFYDWCDQNDFLISKKCYPFPGKGRYVQYPLQEALRVFTTEALLNFARAFVDHGLTPEEDVSYKTFWEIITWHALASYLDSNNASRIYYNSSLRDDAKQQIYNFFLRWDGEYRDANDSEDKKRVVSHGNDLYLTQDYESVEIRNDKGKFIQSFSIESIRYKTLTQKEYNIPIRRKGIFIFQWDPVYQIWQETLCIEDGNNGVALVFPSEAPKSFLFYNCETVVYRPHLRVYQLTKKTAPVFYTEKKTCYLEGGLKIGRSQYLLGAAPFLVREKREAVRIDKELPRSKDTKLNLNYLGDGSHTVSVPGRKPIRFELINPTLMNTEWSDTFSQWNIQKKEAIWRTEPINDGVSGMNFSTICQSEIEDEDSPSKAWAKIYGGQNPQSNNIVIRTLTNIRDYGEL